MNTSESGQSLASVTRTYYALETFCENLGNVTTGDQFCVYIYEKGVVWYIHCAMWMLEKC